MESKFLNVDLVVYSTECLQYLADEIVESVSIHFNGELESGLYCLSFSLCLSFDKTADELVSELCSLLENLSSESKLVWSKCHSKKFDIGFESGSIGRLETEIGADSVRRIAELGASFLVTFYPIRE